MNVGIVVSTFLAATIEVIEMVAGEGRVVGWPGGEHP